MQNKRAGQTQKNKHQIDDRFNINAILQNKMDTYFQNV